MQQWSAIAGGLGSVAAIFLAAHSGVLPANQIAAMATTD
jgi:hypothetical protein